MHPGSGTRGSGTRGNGCWCTWCVAWWVPVVRVRVLHHPLLHCTRSHCTGSHCTRSHGTGLNGPILASVVQYWPQLASFGLIWPPFGLVLVHFLDSGVIKSIIFHIFMNFPYFGDKIDNFPYFHDFPILRIRKRRFFPELVEGSGEVVLKCG